MAKKKTAQPNRNRGAIQANPGTSYKELMQMLNVLGFVKIRQKGSHQIFMSPTGRKISLPAKKKKSELMSPHYEKQIGAAMMNPMDPMVGVAFILDAMMSTGGSCANYLVKEHIKIYKDLERDGLVKITLIDGPSIIKYEDGPLEVYTICADITPKGRRLHKKLRERGALDDPMMEQVFDLLEKSDKKKVKNPSMSLRQDMAEAEREARDRNPSKKRKSKAPTAAELKSECRRLWEHYCERPNKTRLKDVLKHCEKMAESSAKSVKEERARCMRSARREMKKLGMK